MKRVRVVTGRCSFLSCVSLVAGCTTSWGQRPLDRPIPVAPTYPVWIWSRGAVHKWYAVRMTHDSVSGIPFEMPLTCDSCRRSLSRTRVDSMKISYMMGYHTTAKDVVAGVGVATAYVAVALFLEYAMCYVIHDAAVRVHTF